MRGPLFHLFVKDFSESKNRCFFHANSSSLDGHQVNFPSASCLMEVFLLLIKTKNAPAKGSALSVLSIITAESIPIQNSTGLMAIKILSLGKTWIIKRSSRSFPLGDQAQFFLMAWPRRVNTFGKQIIYEKIGGFLSRVTARMHLTHIIVALLFLSIITIINLMIEI